MLGMWPVMVSLSRWRASTWGQQTLFHRFRGGAYEQQMGVVLVGEAAPRGYQDFHLFFGAYAPEEGYHRRVGRDMQAVPDTLSCVGAIPEGVGVGAQGGVTHAVVWDSEFVVEHGFAVGHKRDVAAYGGGEARQDGATE